MTAYNRNDETSRRHSISGDSPNPSNSLEPQAEQNPQDCRDNDVAALDKFEKEIEALINRFSLENGSNTPDFLLAEYLRRCLANWNITTRAREAWYGRR